MLKTIFLDLDDTLLDFHKAEAAALAKALTALDVPPTPAVIARYSAINAQQWRLLEEGRFTRDEILTRRFDILFRELGVERSSALARRTYGQFLGQGHIFIPGAEELLKALAPRYALYLVSNGTAAVQAGRIASAGIAPYFRRIFISEEMGLHKPQKEFFDACFAAIPGFHREEALIIGDSLTSDIRGGDNAGIRTCWFNPQGKPRLEGVRVDYEVSALSQIPPLLERAAADFAI